MPLVIGVPKEHKPFEYRVGLTPSAIALLTAQGHRCYVETNAGVGSGFDNAEYVKAGAWITYGKDEVFRRANLIVKIQRPTEEEVSWMPGEQTIMAFMLLASAPVESINAMQERGITAIAFELIEESDGMLPVLYPLSQIGGRMTAQIATHFLRNDKGGKGILLGGVAGVPPAEVVIIGAGVVGMHAAEVFVGLSARVILIDCDVQRLRAAQERFGGKVTTMMSHDVNLAKVCTFADVLIGAVQVPGQRTPQLISRSMVQSMRPGSLIIDMDIDQGGCVATGRPTQHDQPTFVVDDVIHYCVPNVPGVVGRTATRAFVNAAWPYIQRVAESGSNAAIEGDTALRRGVAMRGSELVMAQPLSSWPGLPGRSPHHR
ncbi:MAG: alanine dehydrogenase [Anaerolineae bacterium]|nr:alanine dehydrogenase [Anaerolineae bacterium]